VYFNLVGQIVLSLFEAFHQRSIVFVESSDNGRDLLKSVTSSVSSQDATFVIIED